MATGLLLAAFVAFAARGWQLAALLRGLPRVPQLAAIEPAAGDALPRVSVVVSALDEAGTIEPALRSLLALDYPALEVVAIDDRSRDATGAILDRLAVAEPRLRVLHVAELPPGWLGKNHALHLGAQQASGDYLLFTDADVHFDPQALRRAIAFCTARRLDHLVVLADLEVREPLMAALLLDMLGVFFATMPPWRVVDSPRVYVGMGAFNLVRAEPYRRMGGHVPIALEVIDDIELGRRMKLAGARQDVLLGRGTVGLEWYADTAHMVRGLEKNSFASLDYSVVKVVLMTLAVLLARVLPLAGLFFTRGATWWLNLAALVLGLLVSVRLLRITRWSARCLWWTPLTAPVLMWILWRSAVMTLWRGGIVWRGTLYPLKALRAFRRASRR